jgi:hypothetical protein
MINVIGISNGQKTSDIYGISTKASKPTHNTTTIFKHFAGLLQYFVVQPNFYLSLSRQTWHCLPISEENVTVSQSPIQVVAL